jgi:hypothetical protein
VKGRNLEKSNLSPVLYVENPHQVDVGEACGVSAGYERGSGDDLDRQMGTDWSEVEALPHPYFAVAFLLLYRYLAVISP